MLRSLVCTLLVWGGVLAPASAQLVRYGPWTGAVTSLSADIRMILHEDRLTNLEVSESKDFRRYESFSQRARRADHVTGMAQYSPSDLKPSTTYYYRVRAGSAREYENIGTFTTLPPDGRPSSFLFAFSSGNMTGSEAGAFSEIRYQRPLFFLHLGNALSDPEMPNELSVWQDSYQRNLESFTQSELYRSVPVVYTWDAFDYGGAITHRAYRNNVPHYPLPADSTTEKRATGEAMNPISQAFSVGRVRFIILDTRTARTPPDSATPTMLGAWQWQWLQDELKRAALTHPLIFIASSAPWHALKSPVEEQDHWGYYPAERSRLTTWLEQNNISGVSILSGNGGVLAASVHPDEPGYLNELQAGVIDLRRPPALAPWSEGHLLPGPTEEFFGLVNITDKRTSIEVTFQGMNQHGHSRFKSSFSVAVPSQ